MARLVAGGTATILDADHAATTTLTSNEMWGAPWSVGCTLYINGSVSGTAVSKYVDERGVLVTIETITVVGGTLMVRDYDYHIPGLVVTFAPGANTSGHVHIEAYHYGPRG